MIPLYFALKQICTNLSQSTYENNLQNFKIIFKGNLLC